IAAKEPGGRRQVRKAVATSRVNPVAHCAIIAEEGVAGLTRNHHQRGVRLDLWIAFGIDLLAPLIRAEASLLQRFLHDFALVYTEQALGVGRTNRPCWHQHPIYE